MLMCWKEDPEDRPTFKDIVTTLTDMACKEKVSKCYKIFEGCFNTYRILEIKVTERMWQKSRESY